MTQKYRFLDDVDMAALHGLRCELDVSANWIGLTPLKGGAPIIIAKATKSRAAKSNGQPATDADTVAAAELAALHEPGEGV